MKIAIVYDMIYPFNIGGAELRNYELGRRLAKKGHEVHLFGVKLWKGKGVIKKDRMFLHGICRYKNLYNFNSTRSILEPIKFSLKLFGHLYSKKFDIIDTSSFPYFHCFACRLVSILRKTPLVFTWHQYWGDYWYSYLGPLKGFFGKNIEKAVKMISDHNIAISQTTKRDLLNHGFRNVFLNYDGVDLRKVDSIPAQRKKTDIIFAGRLIRQKNVSLLINSVGLLKKEFPDIRVCIVGDGPDKEKLKKMAYRLRLEQNITFKGFLREIDDVYKEMKSSKIFVLPSLLEGFGIVVIEANACGLPAIVIDNKWNASKELIDGSNGLIVKDDPQDLASAIKKLFKNSTLRSKMSKDAIKKSKQFDWDVIARELEGYYQRLIHENPT